MPARGQLAGAPIRSASAAKINANKSKEMQGKKLSFPWILLVESGLFNGLQRIQAKKSHGPRFLHFVSVITPCPRSPDSLGDPDQSGGQQQYSTHSDFRKDNVRESRRWFTCRVSPFRLGGVGGPVEATAFGPKPPQPKTGTPHFVGRIIQGGTQSGCSQAVRALCAMRAGLNTPELIAVRCLNPLCQRSSCDESHSAVTKNLDRLRTGVYRANFPR
jgi:hypothetical protein